MPQYDVRKRAKELIREHQDMFVALEELDRTGKLRKASYKKRYNFTIDQDLMHRFRSYCAKNDINMSGKIETLVKEFLNSQAK
ncbi:hypothetical protein JXC34_03390 [Candidatus Woesearchaeota archaeon]|nr:hypothetical protein [Candidatus Woesearchaeota archaeon]